MTTLTLINHIRGLENPTARIYTTTEHPLPFCLRAGARHSLTCLCRACMSTLPHQAQDGEHVQTLWFLMSLRTRSLIQLHLLAIPILPRPSQFTCDHL
jgi:hypothetical protein